MPLIRKKHEGKGRYFSPERYPNKYCERPLIGPERTNIPPIQHRIGTGKESAFSQKIYPKRGAVPALVKFLKK